MDKIHKYEYRVSWSEADEAYIARVVEFPSPTTHGNTPQQAISELHFVVEEVVKDLEENGESVPIPISTVKSVVVGFS
jgi:predicted RNase H-like HicB family nuclease